ncbi:SAM-dependent methyltransferase [Halalkaliarchaeum sp. AArc-CO]|uniref:methyltransferase domain-containing protein n=1 Tax=unclassified Halalkaliarchaeum TaxID=2678344 RepID=UPI00217E4A13|nr:MULTISPECIES: methyltransferase domain-containing protein [unclassified Halalkaliarchaeum]MDR5672367.1 methyltransferase domain-containing protein [Halalkaliarchaeum sp. AArc-GB]UWG50011.1 SAM-dependent methyltransferase [Halalkaliarchaeum sp. AArc-CO]
MGRLGNTVARLEKSCSVAPRLFDLYTRLYRSVVDREIELAEIDEDDVVLNVGCGAMPFTAALLAKRSGATVYALDHDQSVVREARRNLARAGVADDVEVVVGDGREVVGDGTQLPEPCSVAIVALQAEPKDDIVDRYRRTQGTPSRVVVRQPRPAFSADYDPVTTESRDVACDGGCSSTFIAPSRDTSPSPADAVSHWMVTFDRSLLFRTE